MNKFLKSWAVLAILALALASCRSGEPDTPTPTQVDANAVFTAAAQTANARMTEIAAQTPTAPPPSATFTPEPATATPPPTTPPQLSATTAPTVGAGSDVAVFVSDISVPDGTNFNPNEKFTKTWQMKNAGTSTWSTGYSLVFVQGDQMGGSASVNVPSQVAPGASVNISVDLTAPANAGHYRGFWRMRNANGQFFDSAVYVDINVLGTGVTATPTVTGTPGTSQPTNTPGSSQGTVTNVTISVDNANATAACNPYTFNFTAQFTLDEATTVSYKLEAGSNTQGVQITLPDPVTNELDPGTHVINFSLEFTSSLDGWARLHVTAPEDITSNQVNFSLTCQ